MATYITIDGGTTNTRLCLVREGAILQTLKFNTGARAAMAQKALWAETVREGIQALLAENHLQPKEITRILASGMITSEFGLHPLPHATLPAGIKELHEAMEEVSLPEIAPIPFVFLRGLKTEAADFTGADMMRGEETELMGLLPRYGTEAAYLLPGSHSKLILLDKQGRITDFKTLMTGEMLQALAENTILKDAVDLSCEELDPEYLRKGYEVCRERGINEALFKARILKNLYAASPTRVYSYFLGVVLTAEAEAVLRCGRSKLAIGGKRSLKEALAALLEQELQVTRITEADAEESVPRGQIRIYEF